MKKSNLHYGALRKRCEKCRRRLARTLLRCGQDVREGRKALFLSNRLQRLSRDTTSLAKILAGGQYHQRSRQQQYQRCIQHDDECIHADRCQYPHFRLADRSTLHTRQFLRQADALLQPG